MKNKIYNSRMLRVLGVILSVLVWLANNTNPPTGRTGAPFDGNCVDCHGGSNPGGFNGTVAVVGMPSTVEANTTYPLTITLTPTAGSPIRGGFQLVAVDGNNANAGDLTAGNGQSGTEFFNSREYLEHRGGKIFTGGGPASWTFNWKSPVTAAGNTIKFYFIGNFTNGNNQDSGDFPITASETYAFSGPPPVTAVISSTTNVSCFGGNNGSATVEPAGGVPPYTYLWMPGAQNTQTAVNLTAGTYTVTVTGSSGSGSATATAVITQPPVLNASASVNGILTCINTSVTGTANASGGTPPYTYNWSNNTSGQQTQFTAPGTYTVLVTDNNGCTKTAFVNVTSNTTPPNVEAGPPGAISCAQPNDTLNGAGTSTGPTFSYLWTASNGGNILSGATTLNPVVNAAGTYTLAVTNSNNGCTASDATTVTASTQAPTATATGDTLTCVKTSVTLTASTNASQPAFNWSGPNNFSSNQQNPNTSTSGTYTVTVTDQTTGCTKTATATVGLNNTAPTATATGNTITCSTPNVPITSSSTTPGVTYAWTGPNNFSSNQQSPTVSTAGSYTVTVVNPANGCSATATAAVTANTTPPTASATAETLTCADTMAQISLTTNANPATFAWAGPNGFTSTVQNPEVLAPGGYTVTVTNPSNGCTSTTQVTVTQNITSPTASATVPGNLNCVTSSLQLNGTTSSQGNNFQYLWTTVDGNITAGATTLTPTVDAPGTYTLRVTNNVNGCTATTSVTVVESPPVTATTQVLAQASCNGSSDGIAVALPGGGSGSGFTFLWSTSATNDTITNLTAGTYIVTITDSETCTATASVTITEPAVLQANASATGETSAGANDGTATAAPTGGTVPYSFLWSNNATTATITGLAPGAYTVIVTDGNGCTSMQTVTVNSFNCTIAASATTTPVTCNGAGDGTATVVVTGAADPVSYLWSNGDTTATITNLSPGTYSVAILDANNCPAQLSVQITSPAVLLANVSVTHETGLGLNDGTASSQPTGGTAPYSYLWSNSATTATITGLAPGTYTLTLTDNNGCTVVRTVNINAFNCNLTGSISVANVSCFGGNDGQLTALPSGGTAPVDYSWSTGDTTATASNLTSGTYTVTLTDAEGCEAVLSATLTSPTALVATATGIVPTSCPESKDGSFSVVISGGIPPYTYSWPGTSTQNLGVGTYTVTATDANGCSTTVSATIVSNDTTPPVINCMTAPVNFCFGTPVQFSSPPVADNCSLNGAMPELISGLPSGSNFPVGETVQVYRITDVSGNTATCSFSIIVGPPIELNLISFTNDVNNAGMGSIEVSASGGTGGLNFFWKKDGADFANTKNLTGLMAGVYTLIVTDANGCSKSLAPVTITNTVGALEPGENLWVRIMPNPAKQQFRLDIKGIQPATIQLLDRTGQLIRQLEPNTWYHPVEVSDLSAGLYYLGVFDSQGGYLIIKWIKVD